MHVTSSVVNKSSTSYTSEASLTISTFVGLSGPWGFTALPYCILAFACSAIVTNCEFIIPKRLCVFASHFSVGIIVPLAAVFLARESEHRFVSVRILPLNPSVLAMGLPARFK